MPLLLHVIAAGAGTSPHTNCCFPPSSTGRPGMACAWSLSRFPERFAVEVWEALGQVGGVASTCAIDGGALSALCAGRRRWLWCGGSLCYALCCRHLSPALGMWSPTALLLPAYPDPTRRGDQRPGAGRGTQLPQQPALLPGGCVGGGRGLTRRAQQAARPPRRTLADPPLHRPATPPARAAPPWCAAQEFGFEPHEVQLRIAFGTGDCAWTNHRRAGGWRQHC